MPLIESVLLSGISTVLRTLEIPNWPKANNHPETYLRYVDGRKFAKPTESVRKLNEYDLKIGPLPPPDNVWWCDLPKYIFKMSHRQGNVNLRELTDCLRPKGKGNNRGLAPMKGFSALLSRHRNLKSTKDGLWLVGNSSYGERFLRSARCVTEMLYGSMNYKVPPKLLWSCVRLLKPDSKSPYATKWYSWLCTITRKCIQFRKAETEVLTKS